MSDETNVTIGSLPPSLLAAITPAGHELILSPMTVFDARITLMKSRRPELFDDLSEVMRDSSDADNEDLMKHCLAFIAVGASNEEIIDKYCWWLNNVVAGSNE